MQLLTIALIKHLINCFTFRANIKQHLDWGSGHYFSQKLCRCVLLYVGMLQKNVQANQKILATPARTVQ